MIKIGYGVNGVGLGHATASKRIIDELLEADSDMEILIFSSMAALDFFQAAYRDHPRVRVEEVWGIDAQMKKGKVLVTKTALHVLLHLGRKKQRLNELSQRLREERISLLITDFEQYTPRAALRAGIPIIAFSHSLFIRFLKLVPSELPPGVRTSYLVAKNTVRYLYPLGHTTIVNTFYPFPHQEKEGVAFLGPILQREVLAAKDFIEEGDFVLVYPKPPNEALFLKFIEGISRLNFIFYVREPQRFQETKRIKFKEFCCEGFLQDLARCRFVLSTAGHQLPCEALFLKKPMLVIPEGGQFEQYYNGLMLEAMGLGISVPLEGMNPKVIDDFAGGLGLYRERLEEASISDATSLAIAILQRELAELKSR